MTDQFSKDILLKSISKIFLTIGFTKATSTPLSVLSDLLKAYMNKVIKTAGEMASHAGQTSLTLEHIAYSFETLGIRLADLEEHMGIFSDSEAVCEMSEYPVTRSRDVIVPQVGFPSDSETAPNVYESDSSSTLSIPGLDIAFPSPGTLDDPISPENMDDQVCPEIIDHPYSPEYMDVPRSPENTDVQTESEKKKKKKRKKKLKKDKKKHKEGKVKHKKGYKKH